jgi:hypothetical protein
MTLRETRSGGARSGASSKPRPSWGWRFRGSPLSGLDKGEPVLRYRRSTPLTTGDRKQRSGVTQYPAQIADRGGGG